MIKNIRMIFYWSYSKVENKIVTLDKEEPGFAVELVVRRKCDGWGAEVTGSATIYTTTLPIT
jgi:hypothetical protein